MTSERWERVKEVFNAALDCPVEERSSFIEQACANDDALRIEVRRLLAEHDRAGNFLNEPVVGPRETLRPGDVIGNRYRILRFIDRGGMGEVYCAFDELLNEEIAVKTLRADLAHDSGVLRRFQKEIQLARKVTHTNVCRIFEVGAHQVSDTHTAHFFTMELLEGETLASRIRHRGRLSSAEAFPLIAQMAAGLQAAHDAGIVHRDFKSGNVILLGERAVITDFGLARSELSRSGSPHASTVTAAAHIAGTIGYMSPEQLTGGLITPASDIYSFGIVLYEMAAGQLPFDDRHIIQSAVQRATGEAVPVRTLVTDIDRRWESVIEKCLQKNPEARFAQVAEIPKLLETPAPLPPRAKSFPAVRKWPVAIAFSVLIVVFAALFFLNSHFSYQGLKEGATIMISPAVNSTGEKQFDGLTIALGASLDQSSRFRLWDSGRLNSVLGTMRRRPGEALSAKNWREIAFRDRAPFLVFATLSKVASGYALTIHCEQIGAAPDPPLRSWDRTFNTSGPNGVFEAVHDAASWIRTTAGETDAELSAHNRLPQDITSSKWEALQLFEEAEDLSKTGKATAAIPVLRRAVDLDPQFAMGFMRLGDILNAQRQNEEGFKYWREAVKQARTQQLSDHERLSIESRYLIEIGDSQNAEPILRQWVTKFPNDPAAADFLAACLVALGRYPEAIEFGRQTRERFAPNLFNTARIFEALALSGHYSELESELKILKDLNAPTWDLRLRGAASAAREDYATAETVFKELAQKVTGEEASRAISLLAALAADRGDLNQAANLLETGISYDREAGENGLASQKASALAFIENIRGNRQRSRVWAQEAVDMLAAPAIVVQAASVLARQGFIKEAEKVAARMPYGEGPKHEAGLLRVRGEILAAQGHFENAIERMDRASRIYKSPRPQEYLARVFAVSGDHERARMGYAEIVNTPWLVWRYPESEWPGLRLLAKRYLQSIKGD